MCNSCSSRPPKGGAHSRGHRQGAEDLPPSPPAAQLAGIPPSFSGALEKTTITPTHIGRCLALGGNGERPNCKDNIFEFVERCVVKLTYFCPLEMTQKHEFHVAAGQLKRGSRQGRVFPAAGAPGPRDGSTPILLERRRTSARLLEALSLPSCRYLHCNYFKFSQLF